MTSSWIGRINIVKIPYDPKTSIDSMQFLEKPMAFFKESEKIKP